jgi:hypothetical protein
MGLPGVHIFTPCITCVCSTPCVGVLPFCVMYRICRLYYRNYCFLCSAGFASHVRSCHYLRPQLLPSQCRNVPPSALPFRNSGLAITYRLREFRSVLGDLFPFYSRNLTMALLALVNVLPMWAYHRSADVAAFVYDWDIHFYR